MVITKLDLQKILDTMPEKIEVEKIFDRILGSAKVEKNPEGPALGFGQGWEDFKNAWLKEDFNL